MNVTPLQTAKAAEVPIERLAGNRGLSEEQKLAEASRAFESLLLRQILEEAQKTVIPSALTNDSTTSHIYRGMVAEQLAESISKSGAFGLSHVFRSQLTPKPTIGHHQEPSAAPTIAAEDRLNRSAVNRPTEPPPTQPGRHNSMIGKP